MISLQRVRYRDVNLMAHTGTLVGVKAGPGDGDCYVHWDRSGNVAGECMCNLEPIGQETENWNQHSRWTESTKLERRR